MIFFELAQSVTASQVTLGRFLRLAKCTPQRDLYLIGGPRQCWVQEIDAQLLHGQPL